MGQKVPFHADIMAVHDEVTGTCFPVTVKFPDRSTLQFIIDCGLFHEEGYEKFNLSLPFNPESIDFCVVTHNHVDHTGRLPFMVRKGFRKKIYATKTTCNLLPLALKDSLKVFREDAKRKKNKCLYDETDIYNTESLLIPCDYNETININNHVKATFFKNGHLPGSALILIQISYPNYDDINLLFTGDYNNKNMLFDVPSLPNWVFDLPLTVIQESTYGDMESSEMKECFQQNILECIGNNGTVITPVFSIGRSQEIICVLQKMRELKKLDSNIPIFLDGNLAIQYTKLLSNNPEIKPEARNLLKKDIIFVDAERRLTLLEENISDNRKIILTTSGMGSYGPARLYIPKYITRENAMIHFTGYTAKGTLGNKLKQSQSGDTLKVNDSYIKKRARVEYTIEYSAHAKANEMLEFLKQFNDLKLVLINHGEKDVKSKFAKRISQEVKPKDVEILGREYFFRISPYGLVKTITTKFPVINK